MTDTRKYINQSSKFFAYGTLLAMVAVIFSASPLFVTAQAAVTVDIKAEGSDGPVEVLNGDSWSYNWTSGNATACEIQTPTSPDGSGVTLAGNDGPIEPSHPWYPDVGGSTTLTINCTNGTDTATDSVTINIVEDGGSTPPPAGDVSADIKAEGSDGPVTITDGDSWSYSWTSGNATACEIQTPTSPDGSGVTLAGNDGPISPSHPWYPTAGNPTTLTLECTNGTDTATDSVVISVAGAGGTPGDVTADIKANGSDGPVTITNGTSWNYSWTSGNATACELVTPTSPDGSGVTLAGNDGPIEPSHPWYPAVGGSTTLTLNCTDGTDTATDSVVINVVSGGGGGPADVEVDIKINGSDGPVTITNGLSWNYSWTSSGATACELVTPTSPDGSGVTLAGNDGPIEPSHPWYPDVGGSTTLTINCTNGTDTATDSAVINVVAPGAGPDDVEADIKINGSDGPVTIPNGDSWNYSWSSVDATACQLITPTSPDGSGVTLAGTDGPIEPSHPWYPDVGGSTTLTIECTNGTDTATDSATIMVIEDDNGGGGGGGGSSRRNRARNLEPEVLGAVAPVNVCPYLTSYMRMDFNNDRLQVLRLQAFLKVVEGHTSLELTGVFDQATVQAVNAFQLKYASDVLAPWGISQPTGYVYLLTLRKINEIACGPQAPISVPQQQEIRDYVPPKEGVPEVGKEGGVGKELGSGGDATPGVPIVGGASSGDIDNDKGQNIMENGLAAALFTGPQNLFDLMQCLYEFILILIVLYILGSVLENVLYKDTPENVRKKFFTKWITITAGLVVALVGAYLLGEWCLLLPLIVALIISLAWMFLYPKHGNLKTSAKNWHTTVSTRAKNTWGKAKDSADSTTIETTEVKTEKR